MHTGGKTRPVYSHMVSPLMPVCPAGMPEETGMAERNAVVECYGYRHVTGYRNLCGPYISEWQVHVWCTTTQNGVRKYYVILRPLIHGSVK